MPKDYEKYDITGLGESLVNRARDSRERAYKRQRRDAWKLGLIKGGVNLMNRALQKKADEFLISEEAMAIKGKYRSAAHQAQRILTTQQQAQEQGKNMQEYFFENTYLPEVTAHFQSIHGNDFRPEDYMEKIRSEAWRLAEQEAQEFEVAAEMAHQVPDWETAQKSIDNIISPPRSAGEALLGKVTGLFKDQTPDDIRRDILQRIEETGIVANQSARNAFEKILADEGISEARKFVENLDTSGFEPNDRVEYTAQVVPNNQSNSIHVVTNGFVHKANGDVVPIETPPTVVELVAPTLDQYDTARLEQASHQFRLDFMRTLDVFGAVDATLNVNGRAAFHDALGNFDIPITPANFTEGENFERMSEIYRRLKSDPDNLADPDSARNNAEILSTILAADDATITQYLTAPRDGDTDPLEELGTLLQGYMDIIHMIQNPTVNDYDSRYNQ